MDWIRALRLFVKELTGTRDDLHGEAVNLRRQLADVESLLNAANEQLLAADNLLRSVERYSPQTPRPDESEVNG